MSARFSQEVLDAYDRMVAMDKRCDPVQFGHDARGAHARGAHDCYLRLQFVRGEEALSMIPDSCRGGRGGTTTLTTAGSSHGHEEMKPEIWEHLPRSILDEHVLPFLPLPCHQGLFQVVGSKWLTSEEFQRRHVASSKPMPPARVIMGCEYVHLMASDRIRPWEVFASRPEVREMQPSMGSFRPTCASRFHNVDLTTFFSPVSWSSKFLQMEEKARQFTRPKITTTISSEGLICGTITFPFRQDIFVMNPIWRSWQLIPKDPEYRRPRIPNFFDCGCIADCLCGVQAPLVELDRTSNGHFRVVSVEKYRMPSRDQNDCVVLVSWMLRVFSSATGAWRTVTSQDSYPMIFFDMIFGGPNHQCLSNGRLLCLTQGCSRMVDLFAFDLDAMDPRKAMVDLVTNMPLPVWPSSWPGSLDRVQNLPEFFVIVSPDHTMVSDDAGEIRAHLEQTAPRQESRHFIDRWGTELTRTADYPIISLSVETFLALIPYNGNLYAALEFDVQNDWSVLGISKLGEDGVTWGKPSLLPPTLLRPYYASDTTPPMYPQERGVPWRVRHKLWSDKSRIGLVGDTIWVVVEHQRSHPADPGTQKVAIRNVWGYHLGDGTWEVLTSDIKQRDLRTTYALFEPKAIALMLPRDGGRHVANLEAEVSEYTKMVMARTPPASKLPWWGDELD